MPNGAARGMRHIRGASRYRGVRGCGQGVQRNDSPLARQIRAGAAAAEYVKRAAFWLTDYSPVDNPDLQRNAVNVGAGMNPGSPVRPDSPRQSWDPPSPRGTQLRGNR